jgi:hypothetical protein
MNYRELGWGDYLKHLFNKGTAPVEKNYPPTMRPHRDPKPFVGGGGTFRGAGANQDGPARPLTTTADPNSPAVVRGEVPPPTTTPMVVPANRAPTPKLRGNPGNLPGVNDVKPNPWKNMLREGINQMATPGYFDKDRGVWVSGAHAYGEKKAGKAKENKTIEFLKRKGHSKEDAEAIVAQGADAVKGAMAAVKAPRRFDKRGFTVSFEGGKAYATDPRTGEVSPAQFSKEELANGSQSALSDEVVKDISGAIGILDDNESGTFSSMFSAGDLLRIRVILPERRHSLRATRHIPKGCSGSDHGRVYEAS